MIFDSICNLIEGKMSHLVQATASGGASQAISKISVTLPSGSVVILEIPRSSLTVLNVKERLLQHIPGSKVSEIILSSKPGEADLPSQLQVLFACEDFESWLKF